MAAKRLRAVAADEKADPTTMAEAAAVGGRVYLAFQRDLVARTLDDPRTHPRDVTPLTRRLAEVVKEIEAFDSREGGDDIGDAAATPDEAFSTEAL